MPTVVTDPAKRVTDGVRHESCLGYFRRRLREGWKCVSLKGYNVVLLSPDGFRRELDLRNHVETLRPNGAGSETALDTQVPAGGAHWEKVDEAVADDLDYVRNASGPGTQRDLYQIPNHLGSGYINSVTLYARGRFNVASRQFSLRTHGVTYDAGTFGSAVGWATGSETWATNPFTGAAWTWDEIDNLEIGIILGDSVAAPDWSECSQVYVEVTYADVSITDTEVNPTYAVGYGGGHRAVTETEVKPTYFGEGGGGWNVFVETELSPLLPAPEVTTDPALWIGPLSATLDGTLDSGGGIEPCDCGFEWGLTAAYGNTTPTEKKETGESFSQAITGLLPNTTYHFRALATGFGTSYGADRTFVTAPAAILATVTTDPATGLAAVLATVNGTLNQDGGEICECGFEWGLDTGYGTTTPLQSKTTGETFSQVIGGLQPGTTYHFRAFATNSVGTSHGADRTFATALVISRAFALAREEL